MKKLTFLKRLSGLVLIAACVFSFNVHAEGLSHHRPNAAPVAPGAPGREPGPGLAMPETIGTEMPASKVGRPAEPVPEQMEVSVGTAWPIESGYVVTNNHVVAGCKKVVLITAFGREIPASTVLRDEVYDIALLKVGDSRLLPPALPLAACEAGPGTEVFTVGFPRIDILGRTPKLSDGVISRMAGPDGNPVSYQTTVSIQPGNSGGPLLNMKGEVVGVVRSMLGVLDESLGEVIALENASCAVKIDLVKDLLKHLPQQNTDTEALPRHPETLEKLADRIQGSVLIVEAR